METKSIGLACFEPQSFADLTRLGEMAARSRLFAVQSPEAAVVMMLTGASLGLPPVTALRGIHVVQGRAVLSSDLLVAVVLRSGQCDLWRPVEVTAERCTLETRRRGHADPIRHTWTMEMARKASLTGKAGPWQQFPAAMLRARCSAELARMVYPDVLFGVYVEGEIDEEVAQSATQPAAVTREAFGALDASRQIAAAPRAVRELLPERIRDHAEAIAGHNPSGGEWTHAVAAAEAEVRTAEYRVSDAVNDLRESAMLAESLTALAQRWIAAKRDVAAWDDRAAQERAWSAFKARARELGATIKALQAEIARLDTPPPPDGTDGPHAPRSAANDTASAEGSAAPVSGTHGTVALAAPDAWRLSAAGITAHVAEIGNIPRLANSARRNLGAIVEPLRTHAVHVYAGRLQRLSVDGDGSTLAWEACIERTETWLREGPKDAAPPQRRPRKAA